MQSFMPELGIAREKIVFISGIGCAARFPYYMQTYGMHSIHGRAPAIATGLSTSRPGPVRLGRDRRRRRALDRRQPPDPRPAPQREREDPALQQPDLRAHQGQYSPTSELGKGTKSTPMGSLDYPFNPVSLALGAEATFVARAIDTDSKHLTEVLRRAAATRAPRIEIYQNCNVFNDGAFDAVKEHRRTRSGSSTGGDPFGAEGERGVRSAGRRLVRVVDVADDGEDELLVHDEHQETGPRVRPLADLPHAPRPDSVRGLPGRRAGGLRGADGRAARRRQRQKRGEGDLGDAHNAGDTWDV